MTHVILTTMRIVKLGLEEFPTMASIDRFFDTLLQSSPQGKISIDNSAMQDNKMNPEDLVAFLYGGRLVKIASAASSVIQNDEGERHFFLNIESLRRPRRMMRISELQEMFFKAAGIAVNLANSKWNHIQESNALTALFNRL